MPCTFNWKTIKPWDDYPCHLVASQHVHTEQAPHSCNVTACKHYMFQVTGSSFVTVFSRHEGAWRQVDGDKIREGIAALWFTVAGRLRITNDYLAISRQSAARELNRIIKAMDKEDGEYRVDLDALLDMMRQK